MYFILCVLFFFAASFIAETLSFKISILYVVEKLPDAGWSIWNTTQYSLELALKIWCIVQLVPTTWLVCNSVTSSSKKHFKAYFTLNLVGLLGQYIASLNGHEANPHKIPIPSKGFSSCLVNRILKSPFSTFTKVPSLFIDTFACSSINSLVLSKVFNLFSVFIMYSLLKPLEIAKSP